MPKGKSNEDGLLLDGNEVNSTALRGIVAEIARFSTNVEINKANNIGL